ncbi:hypothetical protein T4A_4944, partial [Trichinella pseudospiralis]
MVRPNLPRMAALPSSEAAAFAHTGWILRGHCSFASGAKLLPSAVCACSHPGCMGSRAVHLELVPQMTSARVMEALRRQGRPEIIQSDNFRSFKAATSELRQLWRHVVVERV